jgi:CRISPR-associated protein Csy2
MTWGFPAITAFVGFMVALERHLGAQAGIRFQGVGVVCHSFEPQVTTQGYTRSFSLTRNPVQHDGSTAGIVEEGRVHLDITLVFDVQISALHLGEAERRALALQIADQVAGMRCAGGSVMPPLPGLGHRPARPVLARLPEDPEERVKTFRQLARRWLPGFALVARDDLLQSHLATLQQSNPQATALDAWLALSRWTHRASKRSTNSAAGLVETVDWATDPRQGWTVPIPVGYTALSALHPAGTVGSARDASTPLRFVESVYSIGQWVSPHRLQALSELVWYGQHDEATDLYRCVNHYAPPALPQPDPQADLAAV